MNHSQMNSNCSRTSQLHMLSDAYNLTATTSIRSPHISDIETRVSFVLEFFNMVRPTSENSGFLADWSRLWEPDLDAIAFNGATCDPTRVHPKVLDWVRQSCGENPHFVKVINRNAAHGQPGLIAQSSACLVVPGPFVRENFRKLQRVVTLDNGRGRKWKVSFKSVASRAPVWLRGWRVVARDNNLKPGDVMVLELVGVSHFRITVFDENGEITPDSTSGLRNAGREFKRLH